MDVAAILGAVAPQAGIGAVLLAVLIVSMRAATTDRGDYRASLDAAQERHTAELDRVRTTYETALAELRTEITELRARLDDLQAQLDDERQRRRAAEDHAAQARRGAG